ncbi:MAG: hypothetical protein E5X89_17495 [Mesorhizobium sp.]|nr:MAG: hypothetical protein E5X88_26180 [Mesorhizobium sp.]TIO33164.1 MAG: hypothetical protein E5X89_17495 [Mesorhizobium sp.]TIP08286.1 MAG: hypothetical protein E5X73_32965 [Mesorhizobium sp.]
MKDLQQAEELQCHGNHEQASDNRENSLGDVEGAVQERRRHRTLRGADDLTEPAREPAEEAVGCQSAGIVEQVARNGCASPALITAQRASKAAAHADAVKAAREPSGEDHEEIGHWQTSCRRAARSTRSVALRR